MATTSKTTSRAAAKKAATTTPVIALKKAHKAGGVENLMQAVEEKKEVVFATETDLINGLSTAYGFHRDALNMELATSLIFLASKKAPAHAGEKISLDIKKALRALYVKAGYDCGSPEGEDYKTVQRRIAIACDFYQFVGGEETVKDWVDDAKARVQVDVLAKHLVSSYGFTGMAAVAEIVGRAGKESRGPKLGQMDTEGSSSPIIVPPASAEHPSEATFPALPMDAIAEGLKAAVVAAHDRRASDKIPAERILQCGAMKVIVPFEASFDDITSMAIMLMDFAKKQREAT